MKARKKKTKDVKLGGKFSFEMIQSPVSAYTPIYIEMYKQIFFTVLIGAPEHGFNIIGRSISFL